MENESMTDKVPNQDKPAPAKAAPKVESKQAAPVPVVAKVETPLPKAEPVSVKAAAKPEPAPVAAKPEPVVAKPQPVATVSLQLKKADEKKGKFTLNVTSDDKTIEKKDRNVAEPIQFYSGRDRMLFELVVWTVDKNKATGYLSTPKNSPVPVTAN